MPKNSSRVLPPAIILGGGANALSIARILGRQGVRVYILNSPTEPVRHSRYVRTLLTEGFEGGSAEDAGVRYLISPKAGKELEGAVVLAASDAALLAVAKRREELAKKYRLDLSNPEAQLCMLNKLCTYGKAKAAGVLTPKFWNVQTQEDLRTVRDELVYPLLVKPHLSHLFEERFGKKFVTAHSFEEVETALSAVADSGLDTMLVEWIPGGDDQLCSYYTYIDEQGSALLHFTKRVIRRYPIGMGAGSYHSTDWNPEVKTEALKLFEEAGIRGLANAEFKRDPRDGKLKLMECNARFTAANNLVAASGVDLASFVYFRLIGRPQKGTSKYRTDLKLWDPYRDFHAFRELNRRGEMSFRQWVSSLPRRAAVTPLFRWDDPVPSLVFWRRELKAIWGRRLRKLAPKSV